MTRWDRILHYRDNIYPHTNGWVKPDVWRAIAAIGDVHERWGVIGNLAEIGVYQGGFLLLIECLRNPRERLYAFDIFEKAASGGFVEDDSTLREAWARFYPGHDLTIEKCDSLSLIPTTCSRLLPVRFLSVDALHTALNTFNDLVVAQEMICSGGVVALDDFFNPLYPGVAEGFYRYMDRVNRRLAPVMHYQGKLWLTTATEHAKMRKELREAMGLPFMEAPICGWDCFVHDWPGY